MSLVQLHAHGRGFGRVVEGETLEDAMAQLQISADAAGVSILDLHIDAHEQVTPGVVLDEAGNPVVAVPKDASGVRVVSEPKWKKVLEVGDLEESLRRAGAPPPEVDEEMQAAADREDAELAAFESERLAKLAALEPAPKVAAAPAEVSGVPLAGLTSGLTPEERLAFLAFFTAAADPKASAVDRRNLAKQAAALFAVPSKL